MSDPTFDYAQGEKAVPWVPCRLYRKDTYASSEWTLAPNFDVLSVVDGSNAVAEIQLRAVAGDIFREGATDYAYESIDAWLTIGTYVLVEFYDVKSGGDPDFDKVLERWIGIVTDEGRDVLGKHGGGFAADQTILARGLERLLDQTRVYGSVVNDANAATAVRIDTPMTFNAARAGMATWDRNRAKDASTSLDLGPGATLPTRPVSGASGTALGESGAYAFEHAGDDTKQWELTKILTYLLAFFGPPLTASKQTFTLDTAEHLDDASKTALQTSLSAYVVYGFSPEGLTLFDCLNLLLSPARGLGWKLVYSDAARAGTAGPTIAIFSIQATAVTVGTQTLPAASDRDDLDITGLRDVHWQVRNQQDGSYGRIVVRGQPILSCFSLSDADGTLTKGWTTQEETEYATPPGVVGESDPQHDPQVLHFRAKSRAWTQYTPKKDWDFKAKNGEASGAQTLVNPRFADDGSFVETAGSRTLWDKRFENFIPIESPVPDGADKPLTPTYQDLLVVAKVGTGTDAKWVDVVKNFDPALPQLSYVGALQDRPGVRLRTDPSDLLSPAPVSPGARPTIAWDKIIVTVSMNTETRVSVASNIADGDPLRVLTIDVPDVQLWLIAPGTVVGVKVDQTLDRYTGARAKRDDRDRLKRVLALATAWYGQRRRPVAMQFDAITTRLPSGTTSGTLRRLRVGTFVGHVIDTSASGDINTVITERRFDVARQASAISTGYGYQPSFNDVL